MSFEDPGDGLACDHCGCAPGETRDGRLGFLAPNLAQAARLERHRRQLRWMRRLGLERRDDSRRRYGVAARRPLDHHTYSWMINDLNRRAHPDLPYRRPKECSWDPTHP